MHYYALVDSLAIIMWTTSLPQSQDRHSELLTAHGETQQLIQAIFMKQHKILQLIKDSRKNEKRQNGSPCVDTLVYQLKELDSPLHDIDIINTLMHGIGDEYSPLIVQFETLPSNPDSPDSITIPYVIQCLISKEKQHKTTIFDDISAHLSNVNLKNSTTHPHIRFHCGKEGHICNECNVTPCELYNQKKCLQGKDGPLAEAKARMAQVGEGESGDIVEISFL